MSYLQQKSLYYLVLFTKNFVIFEHPFYSLPNYDKKGLGINKLERNILQRKHKGEWEYAVIYDNKTQQALKYYKQGVEVSKFNHKTNKLKLWIKYKNGTTKTYTQNVFNEQQTYWELINKYIKSKGQRKIIEYARIYFNEKIIGEFRQQKNILIGAGKFHKLKHHKNGQTNYN